MISAADLRKQVDAIVKSQWNEQTADKVPAPEDILLNQNHAKKLSGAVVLYADLDGSTNMVDTYGWMFSAEMYKSYLRCAAQIINGKGGTITSYDGDRVMAIFHGSRPNNDAVETALHLTWAVDEVIRPAYKAQYPDKASFILKHVVGIDSGDLHAVRIGVRNDNDITWVGSAANYAAKMCAVAGNATYLSKAVFDKLDEGNKISGSNNMWTSYTWNNRTIYGSNYRKSF